MIATDIPPKQALQEFRLNLDNQYNSWLSFLLIDIPLWEMQLKIANEQIRREF